MLIESLSQRRQEFQHWVETARDPADSSSEGLRFLSDRNDAALAEYEIAKLDETRWAIRMRVAYRCGNCNGMSIPWSVFETREACLQFFLNVARMHFRRPDRPHESSRQQTAQREMQELLAEGLFGFCEPAASSGV
ncbi:MAG: hypothetical protein KDA86_16445 [Planctomycetaceae bacterium]|nr:hypothetical protein [Planctomycetaceae bacterium]